MESPNDGTPAPSGVGTAVTTISPHLLSEIHARFRREMNADTVAALRRHGVAYRTCFGVPSVRLKAIAQDYAPSVALAEALWVEDIRESKMLATLLFPLEEMTQTTVERWVSGIQYEEIADQACMNLFARLPFAPSLMAEWIKADAERAPMTLYCGLKLAARMPQSQWPEGIAATIREITTEIIAHATRMSLRTAAYWATDTNV